MDTSILHTRIKEYKDKATHPVSKEMIKVFETWFLSIEKYVSDIEMDNFQAQLQITELKEMVNTLADLIIISGNAKIFSLNLKDDYTKEAIQLLLKSKDRKNYDQLSTISTILYLNPEKKFENVKQLKEYVSAE